MWIDLLKNYKPSQNIEEWSNNSKNQIKLIGMITKNWNFLTYKWLPTSSNVFKLLKIREVNISKWTERLLIVEIINKHLFSSNCLTKQLDVRDYQIVQDDSK